MKYSNHARISILRDIVRGITTTSTTTTTTRIMKMMQQQCGQWYFHCRHDIPSLRSIHHYCQPIRNCYRSLLLLCYNHIIQHHQQQVLIYDPIIRFKQSPYCSWLLLVESSSNSSAVYKQNRLPVVVAVSLFPTQQPLQLQPYHFHHPMTTTATTSSISIRYHSSTIASYHQQQQQQHRTMSTKKKQQKQDDVIIGNKKTVDNSILLQLCHSEVDLTLLPHDLFYTRAKFTLSDIQDKVREVFDTYYNMEYYENYTWKPLRTLYDIEQYKGGKIPCKIRIPDVYDDTPLPEGYLDDVTDVNDYEKQVYNTDTYIGTTIKELVDIIKLDGYQRSNMKQLTLQHKQDKIEINTKQWVLQYADNHPPIQSMILRNVGALDHIVEMIHYDFVWNYKR